MQRECSVTRYYFDNSATTRVSDTVMKAMMPYFQNVYGNPSSIYTLGREAREAYILAAHQTAKAIGADAVLLIAAILDDAQMKDFYQLSKELELDALVEVHDEKELERAMKIDADIIGVNNRNLKDFTISLDTTVQLSKLVPEDKVLVAESGILQDADVELLKECGVDAFLIGRALMEAEHPKEVAKRWKA